jgi:5-deoxy-glucuronate isomerase
MMIDKKKLNWKYISPGHQGFHLVVSPENSDCQTIRGFRLNLEKGTEYHLSDENLELNGAVISGKALLFFYKEEYLLSERDSFYLPAGHHVIIKAQSNLVIYFGGAPFEGKGEFFVRKYDMSLPAGNIRQVHGNPPYQREVFMTIAQEDNGSRLICGITEGEPGQWTSWPPHQHSKDLEEIYCYFGIPAPKFALHLASRISGEIEEVYPVSSGDFVIVPEGYHPTVGMPGVKSCYFWIMAAFSGKSRRYDLAVNDPAFLS